MIQSPTLGIRVCPREIPDLRDVEKEKGMGVVFICLKGVVRLCVLDTSSWFIVVSYCYDNCRYYFYRC